MRWSQTFIPTLRETPADAEIASHQLMLRAGLMRRLSSGIYSHLPLGVRVLRKVERILREELERIGAEEVLLPVLHPAELWRETRRWDVYGPELMRLVDRHERAFALGPTHEEVITDLLRGEVRSYRQLPLSLYQIQTKFRDEIRPRFGLLRGREFLMKDAYSFHLDEASLDEAYRSYHEAYARIFARCGLAFRIVLADAGAIGGGVTEEFMVLAEAGESEVLSCPCGYAATSERATTGALPAPEPVTGAGGDGSRPRRVSTPNRRSAADVAAFLGVHPSQAVKTLAYVADGQIVFVLVRGDREVNEAKLFAHLDPASLRLATDAEVLEATGGPTGFSGPLGLSGSPRVLADTTVRGMREAVVGANAADEHLAGVDVERDVSGAEFVDVLQARAGDPCQRCGGPLESSRGIEVGQIFKLGDKYSAAMGATVLDERGESVPMRMGCYGIGVTRTVAAAIEQHHDERGIRWPFPLAPFQVEILPLPGRDGAPQGVAEQLYAGLRACGWEALLDDRDERPGAKFADADLIGIPFRVVVGERGLKQGVVELRADCGRGEAEALPVAEALDTINGRLTVAAREAESGWPARVPATTPAA